jgi:hypothetical protein
MRTTSSLGYEVHGRESITCCVSDYTAIVTVAFLWRPQTCVAGFVVAVGAGLAVRVAGRPKHIRRRGRRDGRDRDSHAVQADRAGSSLPKSAAKTRRACGAYDDAHCRVRPRKTALRFSAQPSSRAAQTGDLYDRHPEMGSQ